MSYIEDNSNNVFGYDVNQPKIYTVYRTSDGKEFASYEEAQKHCFELSQKESIEEISSAIQKEFKRVFGNNYAEDCANEQDERKARARENKVIDEIVRDAYNGYVRFNTIEGVCRVPIEQFCDQPLDGILYDLNRDKLTTITLMRDENTNSLPKERLLNDLSAAMVIEYLWNRLNQKQ